MFQAAFKIKQVAAPQPALLTLLLVERRQLLARRFAGR